MNDCQFPKVCRYFEFDDNCNFICSKKMPLFPYCGGCEYAFKDEQFWEEIEDKELEATFIW